MGYRLTGALLIVAAAAWVGCVEILDGGKRVHSSGHIVSHEETHSGFDEVEVGSSFVVTITRADAYSVFVRADDNVIDHVRVSRHGDTLRVRLDDDHSYRDVTLEAEVTLPAIRRLSLSGASRGTLSGFDTDDPFEVDLSGASSATAEVSAGDVECDLSGASHLTMTGVAGDLSLNASGASRADIAGLSVRDVDAELSGASSAVVRATGTISATLSGASRLEYYGAPALGDISTSGGSSVQRRAGG